jgi:putative mRNA 3-end processing factor
VISDHADWPGLLSAIRSTEAENIYVTHGYTDIFTRYLQENGWRAQVVKTEFAGEEAEAEMQE